MHQTQRDTGYVGDQGKSKYQGQKEWHHGAERRLIDAHESDVALTLTSLTAGVHLPKSALRIRAWTPVVMSTTCETVKSVAADR